MSSGNQPVVVQPSREPAAVLGEMLGGAFVSQAIFVAAKLGIADLVAAGPRPVAELAAETGSHERSLYRVLRTLASVGLFRQTDPKVFAQTALSELLRSDAPRSMRDDALFMGADWHVNVIADMPYSVRTGKPAWGHTHGAEVFEYFAANPEQGALFNDLMTTMTVRYAPAIVEAYDFSHFETLVDVAGGQGYLLARALEAAPGLAGVLFDMPQVLEGATALLEREGVADRVRKVPGDFFASVPAGADAYMLKHIVHDWDDERCVTLLGNIRTAMSDDGKVLIVESVVPETEEPHYSKMLDLEMLVSPGGIERTEGEYRDLLAAAGLRLSRVVPTKTPLSIIEAVKA